MLELGYYAVSALSNALTTLAIALLFSVHKKRYRYFIAFNLFVSAWSFAYFFWQLSTTQESAEFYLKILMLFVVFIPHTFGFFIFEFLEKKGGVFNYLKGWNYFMIAVSIPIIFKTNWFIRVVEPALTCLFWPKAGRLLWVFLMYFGINVLGGLYMVWKEYKKTKREDLYYVGTFTGVGFIGGASNFLLWYDIPFPPVLNISTSIYSFFIGLFFIHSESLDLRVTIGRAGAPFLLLPMIVVSFVVFASMMYPFDSLDYIYLGVLACGWIWLGPKLYKTLNNPLMREIDRHKSDQKRLIGLNKLENDLRKAHEIQNRMLPSEIPSIEGLKIEVEFKAAQIVSGDYYNIQKVSNHEVVVIISDLVGKGVVASMYMLFLHRLMQIEFIDCKSPKEFMNQLNKDICDDALLDRYVPLVCLYVNTKTRKIKYSNAGHEPFLYASCNTINSIDSTNIPLGLDREEAYLEKEISLNTGDRLVLFTDGLTDITNDKNKRLGIDGVTSMLEKKLTGDIFNGLVNAWSQYKGNQNNQDDDFTLLVLSYD